MTTTNISIPALDALFNYDENSHSYGGPPSIRGPAPSLLPQDQAPASMMSQASLRPVNEPSPKPPDRAPSMNDTSAAPAVGAPTIAAGNDASGSPPAAPAAQDTAKPKTGWQKLEHGLSRFGNIAGDILAPGITAAIPGSDLNNLWQQKRAESFATRESENKFRNAQTANVESETAERDNPAAKNPQTVESGGQVWERLPNKTWSPIGSPKTAELPAEEGQWLKDNPGKTSMDYHTELEKAESAGRPVAKEPNEQAQIAARLAPLGMRPVFAADGSVASMQQIPGFKEPEKGTFGGAYAAVRALDESAREFPSMFKPLLEKMNQTQGLGLTPADIDAANKNFLAGLATSGGQPLGTASRLNPTATTESQAQMADKVLNELPRINKEIDAATPNVGPVQGRLAVGFLLGKVGSTGNKQLDNTLTQLRTDVTLLESAGSKFHVGTQKAIDDLAQDIDAGKSSSDALHGFTTSIQHWAEEAQKEGKEVSGRGGEGGHSFTYNGKSYANVPDAIYQKYKGKTGFKE